jgi:hypothetical protein
MILACCSTLFGCALFKPPTIQLDKIPKIQNEIEVSGVLLEDYFIEQYEIRTVCDQKVDNNILDWETNKESCRGYFVPNGNRYKLKRGGINDNADSFTYEQ